MEVHPSDDDVREYIKKRKRAGKPSVSVSHLRKALNIGYKKAKRIHDEFSASGPDEEGRKLTEVVEESEEEEGGAQLAEDEDEEEDVDDLDPFELSNALLKASNFAASKHRLQRRKDKDATPYINHPLGVAWSLSQEGGVHDIETLQGGLLHDTVEDTGTTFEELEREFGAKVASIVRDVTDDKSLGKAERKKHQVSHAPHISKQGKLVKLADKLYNLRDLLSAPVPGWSVERVQGYFVWAHTVIEGIRGTNRALEEKLDEVFASCFTINGQTYPAMVPEPERAALLESYYLSFEKVND